MKTFKKRRDQIKLTEMQKIRVLIVEDELLAAQDIKILLENLGYQVISPAATGEEALSSVEKDRPDIILMDVVLKGEPDGIQTARRIHDRFDIPLIFLTAYSDNQTFEAAKQTQPFGYVLKPIDPKELQIAIEIAIYKHAAERRFRDRQERLNVFINPATDTFCLVDPDLIVQEINRSGLESWRLKEGEVVGQSLLGFLMHPDDREVWAKKYQEVIKTGRPLYVDNLQVFSKSGERVVNLKAYKAADGLGLIITDITEKRALESALRDTQDRYRLLVDHMSEGIVLQDEKGIISYINEKFLEMSGYRQEEVAGHLISEFLDEPSQLKLLGQAAPLKKGERRQYEVNWRKKDGQEMTAIFSPRPIFDDKGRAKGYVTVITDITQRRRVEEELSRSREVLRKLSLHLQSIREKESKRIAREIHDELGQALTALKMDITWISQKLTQDHKDRGRLLEKTASMSGLIDKTIQTVQKISSELRPGLLDDLGLEPAVEWLAQDFENRSGVKCRVNLRCADTPFNPDCATAIFRIIQEALTNVARHAQATKVSIELRENGQNLELRISDNGRGIREEDVFSPESLGLIGMRERLVPLGGSLTLKGLPDKGTRLSITLPLKGARGK